MVCPCCGEEIRSGRECEKCGKGAVASKKMEVQYKDFKVSELLDIKMTSHVPSRDGIEKPEPMPEKGVGSNRAAQTGKRPSAQKALLIVTAFIAVFAVVAGFYLLRFLF
jgi:ribosomal protein L32